MLKANITNARETNRNMHRKDSLHQEIAILDPSNGRAIVTCRTYIPGTVAYVLLWISGNGVYARGTGKAGGYGYHKPSAALDSAIGDAGITLHGDVYGGKRTDKRARISGVGDSAMVEALEAIARAVTGKRKFITHKAHA